MEAIKVSIIIPVYNMARYIGQCIDSILDQTLNDFEVICIDDGSTDDSINILQGYSDKRIFIHQQSNQGAGSARNYGIRMAKGDYVAFLDSDDWYPEKDILETSYSKAIRYGAKICGGSFSIVDDGEMKVAFEGEEVDYIFHSEGFICYKDYQYEYGYHRFIYKREFLLENEIFYPDYRRFQDPPFFVKAMVKAEQFYAFPKVTYCYRVGSHNKVSWDERKVNDLTKGLIDNLNISKEYGLAKLHTRTILRINGDYLDPIMDSLRLNNLELLELLVKANGYVDEQLYQGDEALPNRNFYLLPIEYMFKSLNFYFKFNAIWKVCKYIDILKNNGVREFSMRVMKRFFK